MEKDNKKIRVRFAPSPTGHLHVGSVRVAMFNWLFAKHNDGKYLVRIEDTDIERSEKEFLDSQLSSLKWLDLLPEEPILYQMSRIADHKKIIKDLLDKNLAYPCFCDPSELEKNRFELMEKGIKGSYICKCADKAYDLQDLKKPHAIRFKIPEDCNFVEFKDAIRGNIKVEKEQLDDFIIMRQDGTPTYNFVVVVDDIFMKISHVIRGEDHISNTPKQILIYKALNAQVPVFAHLPLILGPSGNRLSKRDAAVSVQDYKKQGFLPDALFNYLVRLGWAHGDQEIFTKEELIKFFSLDKVGKKGAIFDIKKLEWLNGVYIRKLDFDQFLKAVDNLGNDYIEKLNKAWNINQQKELFIQYQQRSSRLLDMIEDIISLAHAPKVLNLDLIKKWINKNSIDLIKKFLEDFEKLNEFDHEKLMEIAKFFCEKFNEKLIFIAQPLRLAITGKIVSPGVFELICILGKEDIMKRINFLLKNLEIK